MEYKFSKEKFCTAFNISLSQMDSDSPLKHIKAGKAQLNLFPFTTRGEVMPRVPEFIGAYIRHYIGGTEVSLTDNEIKEKLFDNVEFFSPNDRSIFYNVIKELYFENLDTDEGTYKIQPKNLRFMSTIPCTNRAKVVANFIFSVLGEDDKISKIMQEIDRQQDQAGTALDVFMKEWLGDGDLSEKEEIEYFKVVHYFDRCFTEDLLFLISRDDFSCEDLFELIRIYYLNYVIQTSLQLDKFFDGSRDEPQHIYYCMENEKTSQNRECFIHGWKSLDQSLLNMYVHTNTIEMLNASNVSEKTDYLLLKDLLDQGQLNQEQTASQIRQICDFYILHINFSGIENVPYRNEAINPVEREIMHLFDVVRFQFMNSSTRGGVLQKYAKTFSDEAKDEMHFLQNRGRSGDMLCISDERLIFLTKIAVKNKEMMKLSDVFTEFEKRGIFLDTNSKVYAMQFYERLNLIEKKSDSGDAQYVKRIL